MTGRLAHLALRDGPLLRFGDALIAAGGAEASVAHYPSITFRAQPGTERPVSRSSGRLRAAESVDVDGRITCRDIRVGARHLLTFDRAAPSLGIAAGPDTSIGLGRVEALAGLRMQARF